MKFKLKIGYAQCALAGLINLPLSPSIEMTESHVMILISSSGVELLGRQFDPSDTADRSGLNVQMLRYSPRIRYGVLLLDCEGSLCERQFPSVSIASMVKRVGQRTVLEMRQ